MKKIFVFLLCSFIVQQIYAQQIPQFSQNMFNKLYNNPGFAGSEQAIRSTAMYRSQWMGFDGAPTQLNLSVDAAVPVLHGGLGLNIVKDDIAQFENLGIKAIYSYTTELGAGQLGIGTSLGIMQIGNNGEFDAAEPNDPSIPPADKESGLELGFGLYYNTQDVYIGLASNQLNEQELNYTTDAGNTSSFKLERHYFLIAGYYYPLSSELSLNPSFYLKSDGATSQLDINTNLIYNNKIWGGVSYRLDEGLVILTGLNVTDDLKLGIAYDVVLNSVGNNSIEVMLGYNFGLKINKSDSRHKNPRFL